MLRFHNNALALVLVVLSAAAARAVHWQHAQQLTDDFRLLWSISDDALDITFEVQARTHGYVGLGLTRPGDRTPGADLIVGWVDNGQTYLQVGHRGRQTAAAACLSNQPTSSSLRQDIYIDHTRAHARTQSFNYKYNITTYTHTMPTLTS